jgi:WD repeat-containing protein 91
MTENNVFISDELLKEYLIYRGFSKTLKQYESEKKVDKSKGYNTESMVNHLLSCLLNFDYKKFIEYWNYLKSKFFSRLDYKFFETGKYI